MHFYYIIVLATLNKDWLIDWLITQWNIVLEKNTVADATSRNPIENLGDTDADQETEISLVTAFRNNFNKIRAVTWERIEAEMEELRSVKHQMPLHLSKYNIYYCKNNNSLHLKLN